MILYLLAFLGCIIHLIMKWRDAWTKKEKFDIKRQTIISLVSLPLVFVIIFLKGDLTEWLSINITSTVAFFMGYFSDSVVKNLEAWGRKKITPRL